MTKPRALAGQLNAYDDAPAGTALPRFRTGVDRLRQAIYHAACDIDSATFDGHADATILAQDNSIATTRAELPNDGRIHTRHVIRQRDRIKVGDPLIINGRVGAYAEAPRGRLLTCLFAFLRADMTVPLEMETEYLLPWAEPPADDAGRARPSAQSETLDGFRPAGRLALTPEKVMAYSEEVGNRIHFDPEFAAAGGYRAPLAQGLMQLTALHAAMVATHGAPRELDLEVRFRRPVFWDVDLSILASADGRRYVCVNEDRRITADMTIRHIAD